MLDHMGGGTEGQSGWKDRVDQTEVVFASFANCITLWAVRSHWGLSSMVSRVLLRNANDPVGDGEGKPTSTDPTFTVKSPLAGEWTDGEGQRLEARGSDRLWPWSM